MAVGGGSTVLLITFGLIQKAGLGGGVCECVWVLECDTS